MKVALIGDSITEGRPGVAFAPLLEQRFSDITFVNLGKPGETVTSLYNRLEKMELEDYDITFLWIGVNDIFTKLLRVQAQPVCTDLDEFSHMYQQVTTLLLPKSKKLVLVSPALVGEQVNSEENETVQQMALVIEKLATQSNQVFFLPMHLVFRDRIGTSQTSSFINIKVGSMIWEALFYKKAAKVDRLSKKRGLQLTIDGVHLIRVGAQLAADTFEQKLHSLLREDE